MINAYLQNWLDVIENMSNDNTYKLAWGRSILECIGDKKISGDLVIDFDELSCRIIKYYWNQLYFFNLTQGKSRKPVIEQIVKELIKEYQTKNSDNIPVWYERAEAFFKQDIGSYNALIKRVSRVLTFDVSWRFMNVNGATVPLYVLDKKNRKLFFKYEDALVLYDNRFILSQLLNYRWTQLLEQFNVAPKIASKVKGLSDNAVRRKNLSKYKKILLDYVGNNPIDFYTGKVLADNDISVDHVIPWSFMYSDDIWNLVLTSKSNNSRKSNSVPSLEDIERLKRRNEELVLSVGDSGFGYELVEAINNDYVDRFYNSLRM